MLHFYKKNFRIGLDVDEVLADFLGGFSDFTNGEYKDFKHFYFSYKTNGILDTIPESFWLNLPSKVDGLTLPFIPTCYISSRTFDERITEEWLEKNNFPCMPVIHTHNMSKLDACKKMGVNIFADDFINNFMELHEGGIKTFLIDCEHNKQYNVDPYRLDSLYNLPMKISELGL